jgi:hypothetical protein
MKTKNQIIHRIKSIEKKIKVLEYDESKNELDLLYLKGELFSLLWVLG